MKSQPVFQNARSTDNILNDSVEACEIAKYNQDSAHMGYTCDSCTEGPISGIRYECLSCSAYNLCMFCYSDRFSIHNTVHKFKPYTVEDASLKKKILPNKNSMTSSPPRAALTDEQKKRMEENKRKAEARRLAKLEKQQRVIPSKDVPLVTTSCMDIENTSPNDDEIPEILPVFTLFEKEESSLVERILVPEPPRLVLAIDESILSSDLIQELRKNGCGISVQCNLEAEIMPSLRMGIIRRSLQDLQIMCQHDALKSLAGYLCEMFPQVIVIVETQAAIVSIYYILSRTPIDINDRKMLQPGNESMLKQHLCRVCISYSVMVYKRPWVSL